MSQRTLLTALAVIRAGWTKGSTLNAQGCHCLLGAIAEAHGVLAPSQKETFNNLFSSSPAMSDVKACAEVITERVAALPSLDFRQEDIAHFMREAKVDPRTYTNVCYSYNDSPACTQGDVELVLSEAAKRSLSAGITEAEARAR